MRRLGIAVAIPLVALSFGSPASRSTRRSRRRARHHPVTGLIDAALWLLASALLVGLVVLSVMPRPPRLGSNALALHAGGYASVTFVLLLAAVWRPGRGLGRFARSALVIATGLTLVGMGLEIVQGIQIFAGRRAEVPDALANAVGVGIGGGVWAALRSRLSR